MPKCWERSGKRWKKSEMVRDCIMVFTFGHGGTLRTSSHEQIWLFIPLIPVSPNQGLPSFVEGSHRWEDPVPKSYSPILRPGVALIFDGRLQTTYPNTGGGVVFARAYDLEKPQAT